MIADLGERLAGQRIDEAKLDPPRREPRVQPANRVTKDARNDRRHIALRAYDTALMAICIFAALRSGEATRYTPVRTEMA